MLLNVSHCASKEKLFLARFTMLGTSYNTLKTTYMVLNVSYSTFFGVFLVLVLCSENIQRQHESLS